MFRRILFLLLCLLPASASADSLKLQGNKFVSAKLVADRTAFQPALRDKDIAGALGVQFDIAPGWHIYWKNSGEAGMPTDIQWELPPGWNAGPLYWPAPEQFTERGAVRTLGLAGRPLLFTELKAPRENAAEVSARRFAAKISFLVCNDLCVPGELQIEREIPYGAALPLEVSEESSEFERVRNEAQGDYQLAPLPAAAPQEARTSDKLNPVHPNIPLWWALLSAFLAGLILNFMPCVLPVISLKTFGLLEARAHSKAERLRDAFWFSAGVLASFGALATTVALLRTFSIQVKWGFQFQSPVFVGVLALIVGLLGLGFFDGYSLRLPGLSRLQKLQPKFKSRPAAEFFDGVLVTLLSTPCTAPFLGTALLLAFTQSTGITFAIFLAIGLGLAAPFVLIVGQPRLMRLIPKPGAWMNSLKKFFGLLMLGTAAWLLWVLSALLNPAGEQPAKTARALNWQPYAETAVEHALASGQTVFIDFTADWCVTCKFNENFVLNTEAVEKLLSRPGLLVFKADFTARDEKIHAALTRYNGQGVPHYVLLKPGAVPEILPPLLSAGILKRALATSH